MAGENVENKVKEASETPDSSKELEQLNANISSLQKTLSESWKSNEEKFEITRKISELEAQKNKILENSVSEKNSLGNDMQNNQQKELSKQDEKVLSTALKWSDLSEDERKKVEIAVKTNNISSLGVFEVEWWSIWWIIIALLSTFFWSESAEYEWPYIDGSKPISDKEKKAFAESAKKEALKIQEKYGIPWEVSVAQCILESGWGQSKLARKHGNYFWIKWKGVSMMTKEDYAWKLQDEMASFRTYKDMDESFEAYAQFLLENKRYSEAFNYGDKYIFWVSTKYQWRDPIQFLIELKKANYATDSEYVKKVTNVINSLKKSDI